MSQKQYRVFIVTLALIDAAIAVYASSTFGAGIAGDSTHYISTADNLAIGRGLFDFGGGPLIWWPPLYPIVLAGLRLVTGSSSFQVAWYFSIFLLALNLVLSGLIIEKALAGKRLLQIFSVLFIFLLLSNLRIYLVILSEPLYLTFTLLFLLASADYLEKRELRSFLLMMLWVMLACLERYPGLVQVLVGSLIVIYANRKNALVAIRNAALFGPVTALPLGIWLYGHNYLQYHTVWGPTTGNPNLFENLRYSLVKIIHWFVPFTGPINTIVSDPFIILIVLIILLVVINRRVNWLVWINSVTASAVLPGILFSIVYYAATIYLTITDDQKSLYADRYYVMIATPILIFLALTFEHLIRPHLRLNALQLNYLLIGGFIIWSIYPISEARQYTIDFRQNGEPTQNVYNTRRFRDSDVLKYTRGLISGSGNPRIYSNLPPVIWFFLKYPVDSPPAPEWHETNAQIRQRLTGWPGDKSGYLVWFLPDDFKLFVSPNILWSIVDLKIVYQGKDGVIYYISPKSSQ